MVKDNIFLGKLNVPLPSNRTDNGATNVRFTYDVNGLLQVEATVVQTGKSSSVIIEGNPGLLSQEEIAERLAVLSELKIHPRDKLEFRTLLARAERIYLQLRGDYRVWFSERILAFEQALDTQEIHLIANVRQQFEQLLAQIERDSYLAHDFVSPNDSE